MKLVNHSARVMPMPPTAIKNGGRIRSQRLPTSGFENPWTTAKTENAPASTDRDQLNSSSNATRNTLYAYQIP